MLFLVCPKWKKSVQLSWYNVKKLYYPSDIFDISNQSAVPCEVVVFKLLTAFIVVQQCATYVQDLNINGLSFASVLLTLKGKFGNLRKLNCRIETWKDENFVNIFENMKKLEDLTVTWSSDNSDIPATFVEALNFIAGQLKKLTIHNDSSSESQSFSPLWVSVSIGIIIIIIYLLS